LAGFDSLLIANRGEIVLRIARSARLLGLRTIAVASDADCDAPHARGCDAVVAIGGNQPADSYLRADKLLRAARACGAQAVHPGYGFLSESPAFAQAVIDAGLAWIGPPPEAMRAMADKSIARRRLAASAVPMLPGDDAADQDPASLRDAARRIGVPLMVKASAGGGGRGMRLVLDESQLDAALASAAAEAHAAFGDARVLLERALVAPRHVEVQLFADQHGNVVALGERDCSVQRRHQKLVEEAPSPAVSAALRRRMADVAVRVAREVGYEGAGTVEFLLDAAGEFWFIEMNTRLQVEHAVTEALLGIDLVEWQLRVAAGERLPWNQDEVWRRFEGAGHAIEVRLCAEDPAHDFLPQAGRLQRWRAPDGVRCDAALADGVPISPYYDSMLAKLIAHADSRAAATRRLAHALDRTVCLGVATNRAFLARLLRHPTFEDGAATTAFIATHYAEPATRSAAAPDWLAALAAAATVMLPTTALPPLWHGWTSSGVLATDACIEVAAQVQRWVLRGTPREVDCRRGDAVHRVAGLTLDADGRVHATVDGAPRSATLARDGTRWMWLCEGFDLDLLDLRLAPPAAASASAAGALHAPMHGRVTQVLASAGSAVQAGALLLVMEAMKMEHRLHAPRDGIVKSVSARAGEQVAARQLLVELEP
jgi:geranyl-CoA carboxylase alpha subunit